MRVGNLFPDVRSVFTEDGFNIDEIPDVVPGGDGAAASTAKGTDALVADVPDLLGSSSDTGGRKKRRRAATGTGGGGRGRRGKRSRRGKDGDVAAAAEVEWDVAAEKEEKVLSAVM